MKLSTVLLSAAAAAGGRGLRGTGYGSPLQGAESVPDGSQLAPQCGHAFPSPSDGLGLGPVLMSQINDRLTKTDKTCETCETCEHKVGVIKEALRWIEVKDGSKFWGMFAPSAKISILGGGATNMLGFAHTYSNMGEFSDPGVNACYSAAVRGNSGLNPTWGMEDVIVGSCGDHAVLRLFDWLTPEVAAANIAAGDKAALPMRKAYPQRYSMLVHFEDVDTSVNPNGFQIVRWHVLMDSELTAMDTLDHVPEFHERGIYVGSDALGWKQGMADLPTPPTPQEEKYTFERLTMEGKTAPIASAQDIERKTAKGCAVCASCSGRFSAIKAAFEAYASATSNRERTPVWELLADDVKWTVSGVANTRAGCFSHRYHGRVELLQPSFGMWARLDAMTASVNADASSVEGWSGMAPVVTLDSCGTKANVMLVQDRVGKSGFRYSHYASYTLYLTNAAGSAAGFEIKEVVAVEDTEVLLNLAEREQAWDTYRCPYVGDWTKAISHTRIQP